MMSSPAKNNNHNTQTAKNRGRTGEKYQVTEIRINPQMIDEDREMLTQTNWLVLPGVTLYGTSVLCGLPLFYSSKFSHC
jgi:hypothetical protein